MKNLIYTILLLIMTSFMTVGCTDAIAAAAIDKAIDAFEDDDNEEEVTETSADTLTLTKISDGFTMVWDKKDTEYNEVIYRDENDLREPIMVGSTAIIRSYVCTSPDDTGESVNYSCVGLGTPGPDNDSIDGKITLNFQKDTDYAFFVDGELIHNILSYRDDTLTIIEQ